MDTGNLSQAMQATFPGLGPNPEPLVLPGTVLGIAFYTALLYMIRYARQGLVSAQGELAPLLPDRESGFRRIFGRVHAPLPVVALAGVLVLFFWLIGSHAALSGTARAVFVAFQLAVSSLSIATVLWTYFVTLWGLRVIGRQPLRLKPYTEDPMLGLRPVGAMAVSATRVYFAMIAVVFVTALIYPQSPAYLAFLLVLLGFGVLLFVLPLLGVHRTMVEEKGKAEAALATLAAVEWKAVATPPPPGEASPGELRRLFLELRDFVAHDRAERKVATLPTWPFDPAVTGRIAAIILTGVVAVLGRAAVDWFLARP